MCFRFAMGNDPNIFVSTLVIFMRKFRPFYRLLEASFRSLLMLSFPTRAICYHLIGEIMLLVFGYAGEDEDDLAIPM